MALAIQLVLSFGHLHFAGSAAAAALASAATEPVAASPETPPVPAKHPGVADYCTICANLHLAGLPTAEPPSVPAQHLSSPARLIGRIEARSSAYSGLPFHARAPPVA